MGKDKRQSEDAVLTKVTAWERETAQNEQLKKQRMMEAGCIQGGCSGHEAIDELCERCGFWQEEDKRRRELPLAVKADGSQYKDISGRKPRPRKFYADSAGREYGIVKQEQGWQIAFRKSGTQECELYGKKQRLFETQDQAQKALDTFAKQHRWDEII